MAPELVNWWVSSSAEYAAFAGEEMPLSRRMAQLSVMISIWSVSQQDEEALKIGEGGGGGSPGDAYRVEGEDADNLVILAPPVDFPAQLFGQRPGQEVDMLLHLPHRLGPAGQGTGIGVLGLCDGKSPMSIVQGEVADGDRVGDMGQLWHEAGRAKEHCRNGPGWPGRGELRGWGCATDEAARTRDNDGHATQRAGRAMKAAHRRVDGRGEREGGGGFLTSAVDRWAR